MIILIWLRVVGIRLVNILANEGGIKLKKLLIILGTVFTLLIGIGLQQSVVQASTWHRGMPKALIGKWKHHTGYLTDTDKQGNKVKVETAYYFHGYKNSFITGGTYLDESGAKVRYNKNIGHHTYKIWYIELITKKNCIAYIHWYSKNKIGCKWSSNQNKYITYNSRAPIYNYPYKW